MPFTPAKRVLLWLVTLQKAAGRPPLPFPQPNQHVPTPSNKPLTSSKRRRSRCQRQIFRSLSSLESPIAFLRLFEKLFRGIAMWWATWRSRVRVVDAGGRCPTARSDSILKACVSVGWKIDIRKKSSRVKHLSNRGGEAVSEFASRILRSARLARDCSMA